MATKKEKARIGTVGLCVRKIQEYLKAPDNDPELGEKKDKAERAAAYLEAIFGLAPDTVPSLKVPKKKDEKMVDKTNIILGVSPDEVELLACAGDMLWIT